MFNYIKARLFICVAAISLITSGCFTGVESTPKITQRELKKQNVTDYPELHVLDAVKAYPPADWAPGKRFYIADNRASRALWRIEPFDIADSLAGRTAVLRSVDTIGTLTANKEINLTFNIEDNGAVVEYRTGLTPQQWAANEKFVIPHFIDLEQVNDVKKLLNGRSFYILPSRRTGFSGNDTIGTRYQKVTVIDVEPFSESTPFRVLLADDENHFSSVMMSMNDAASSARKFENLFSLTNPRDKYKSIDDETWNLIQHGRLKLGMTPDQCRLALGSPDTYRRIPTTAGMVERWSYNDGTYLLFEEGVLSAYRQ